MAERSALTAAGPAPAGAVTITERRGLGYLRVAAWADSAARVAAVLAETLGVTPPGTGREAAVSPVGDLIVAPSPDAWLLILASQSGETLAAALAEQLGPNDAAISVQDDGLVALRLVGPRTRDALAKGSKIDLDPVAFPVGAVAQSPMHKVGALLHRSDEDIYDVYVARSYARTLHEALIDASLEF